MNLIPTEISAHTANWVISSGGELSSYSDEMKQRFAWDLPLALSVLLAFNIMFALGIRWALGIKCALGIKFALGIKCAFGIKFSLSLGRRLGTSKCVNDILHLIITCILLKVSFFFSLIWPFLSWW